MLESILAWRTSIASVLLRFTGEVPVREFPGLAALPDALQWRILQIRIETSRQNDNAPDEFTNTAFQRIYFPLNSGRKRSEYDILLAIRRDSVDFNPSVEGLRDKCSGQVITPLVVMYSASKVATPRVSRNNPWTTRIGLTRFLPDFRVTRRLRLIRFRFLVGLQSGHWFNWQLRCQSGISVR